MAKKTIKSFFLPGVRGLNPWEPYPGTRPWIPKESELTGYAHMTHT